MPKSPRTALMLLGLGSLAAGCKATEPPRSCDPQSVKELADAIEEAGPEQRYELVVQGLPKVCQLPGWALRLVVGGRRGSPPPEWSDSEFEELRSAVARACPEGGEALRALDGPRMGYAPPDLRRAFDECEFARYEVLPRALFVELGMPRLAPWGVHQWMLDQGVPAERARPITLALMSEGYEHTLLAALDASPRRALPGSALPLDARVLGADLTKLQLGTDELAGIDDCVVDPELVESHLVRPLFLALELETEMQRGIAEARGEAWRPRPLLFAFHEGLCVRSLFDAALTASRLELEQFGLVVEHAPYEYTALPLPLMLPGRVDEREPRGPPLEGQPHSTVVLGNGELEVQPWQGEVRALSLAGAAGLGFGVALRAFIGSRCAELEQPVLIHASDDVTIGELLDLLLALRGPGCRVDGSGECCAPEVMVVASFDEPGG